MTGDDQHGFDRPGGAGLVGGFEQPPDAIRATYDEWAASGAYDDDVASWGYRVPELLAEFVVSSGSGDGSVLDAGCGTGRGGVALRALGVDHVIGGDFSETSLTAPRARGVYDDVVELDLTQPLSFDDRRFSAVISAGVFSYIDDPAPALLELLRIVEVDGLVAFSQRTDLWTQRGFDRVIGELTNADVCTADVSEPVPYLPGHPDFGDDLGARLIRLRRTAASISRRVV